MTQTDTPDHLAPTAVPGDAEPEEFGLAVALVRLSHLVQGVFGEVSRDHGLTPAQTQLLCRLVDGPVGMAELARMLNLEKSSLTGLVDRVEHRGLVARTRSSADRRACRVALTGLGERLATDSHRGVTNRLDVLMGDLPPGDRERLTAAIARMVAAPPQR